MKLRAIIPHALAYTAVVVLSACGGSGSSSSTSSIVSSSISSSVSSSLSSSSSSSSSSVVSSESSSSSSSTASSQPTTTAMLKGVSIAGADFGELNLPGEYNVDYTYPGQAQVDYYKSKNMNLLRLPFRWERLQRTLFQDFDTTEFNRLHTVVSAATAAGMNVLLDPHNYARYHDDIIGSDAVSYEAFADFWTRLANQYKDNPLVLFGLMNEPKEMDTEQWVAAANAAAKAIRDTGATNMITVPGNAWTGAHSWYQDWYGTPNAVALLDFVDPGDNYVIEVHQYFDINYDGWLQSGEQEDCISTDGSVQLQEFTNWLAENNMRGFLGEFAGINNEACRQAVDGALKFIEDNSEHWLGWAWWAGGPWWTWEDNYLVIEPSGTTDAPQMQWLEPYLP